MRELLATSTSQVLTVVLAALCCASLVAQKMPDPHDNRRVVQLHDASAWLDVLTERLQPGKRDAAKTEALAGFAAFARSFVEPPLEPGADIAAMAQRYVVVIAEPQQQAWVGRLLAQQVNTELYEVELQLRKFVMSTARFNALVAPLLEKSTALATGAAPAHGILLGQHGTLLTQALCKLEDIQCVKAPSVQARAMVTAKIKVGRELWYVKDFHVQGRGADFTATPIYSSMFDGLNVEASCGRLADGRIGVGLNLKCFKVQQPIPEFKTTLAVGHKVTIQLPNASGIHWRHNLKLPKGGTSLCSFARGDEHLVFLLSADALP
tara:strand:+ start:1905 stop:2870 length:966 start_codon:yes stop_codon:yes gene_type:complete